jgi:hypothetical protein
MASPAALSLPSEPPVAAPPVSSDNAKMPVAPALAADANLLFGVLALQMDFVGRDQLIAGMQAWVHEK